MSKTGLTVIYQALDIPDPACTEYLAIANGDVRVAIAEAFEHLLRFLAYMKAGSCWVKIVFIYNPKDGIKDRQSRLKLYLISWSSDMTTARNLERFIQGSPLSRYYRFERIDKLPEIKGLGSFCEIIRRQDIIKPLYRCDMNYKIPDYYLNNHILTANTENDFLPLDRVFDCIDEPAKITILVKPADISDLINDHAAYMARLGSINNRWDFDDEDFGNIDYLGQEGHRYIDTKNQLKPLSYRDHLAGDILQDEGKVHKRLHNRHLSFVIKAEAKTVSTAGLVGSVLAECGFKDDSCRIIAKGEEKSVNQKLSKPGLYIDQQLSDNSDQIDSDINLNEYENLRRLCRFAGIDELYGIFRLPVGSYFSPYCIRKNSDPPEQVLENLIVLGYDMETGGVCNTSQPRGVDYDILNKHLGVFGMPGCGKTTAVMSILLQLSCGSLFSGVDDQI
jgi:hypothetical protein